MHADWLVVFSASDVIKQLYKARSICDFIQNCLRRYRNDIWLAVLTIMEKKSLTTIFGFVFVFVFFAYKSKDENQLDSFHRVATISGCLHKVRWGAISTRSFGGLVFVFIKENTLTVVLSGVVLLTVLNILYVSNPGFH